MAEKFGLQDRVFVNVIRGANNPQGEVDEESTRRDNEKGNLEVEEPGEPQSDSNEESVNHGCSRS